jgi:hypothetical protein
MLEGPFEAQFHAPMLVTSLWRESARVEGVGVGSVGLSLIFGGGGAARQFS